MTDLRVAKFFALIFAVVGIVMMAGTAFLSFSSMDRPVTVLENPDGAAQCSQDLQKHINDGNLTAAAQLLYGQPSFGAEDAPEDPCTAMLWEAFLDSMTLTYNGNLYLLDSELARDGTITVLNVPAVIQSVQSRAQAILDLKEEAAQDRSEIYDADGNLRADVSQQILQEAVTQALAQDATTVTRDVTFRLIRREGQWWILPDQTFLRTITGQGA